MITESLFLVLAITDQSFVWSVITSFIITRHATYALQPHPPCHSIFGVTSPRTPGQSFKILFAQAVLQLAGRNASRIWSLCLMPRRAWYL